MFKKLGQIIFFTFLLSLAAVIQFSAIYALPSFFRDLNLLLIILVFTLFFYDFRSAVGVAIITGFWLDVLSFNFFGFYLISFFLTLIFTEWILKSWLTNRSLYSFWLLILLATLANNIIVGFFSYFLIDSQTVFFMFRRSFWLLLAGQIVWSEIFALLMFSAASAVTRRFQPFFLEKK